MIRDLKPYAAYKDSSVQWLGEIPEHWQVRPTRALFEEVKDQNHPNEPLLSVTISRGVISQSELLSDTSKKDSSNLDKSKYKLIQPGDIAYNKMRAWQGAIGASRKHGIISPAYVVQRPRHGILSEYMHYLFRIPSFATEAERWSYGITSDQWSLRPEHFKMIYCSVPSWDEQVAIVRFLYHADRRIRRYVVAKQRLIKLLEEQKQAIIYRAVTRGFDPRASLKPVSIEQLSAIPNSWAVLPFVRCTTERADYRGATPEKVDEGVFLITAKNVRMGWIDYETSKEYIRSDQYERIMRRGLPKLRDLLLTTEAPLGNVALVDREDVAMAQRVIRFRMNEQRLVPEFAQYALMSSYCQDQLKRRGTGSTALGIKASKLPQLILALPSPTEQRQIVERLDNELASLEAAARELGREIGLVREYRTRLISDVVTGKLDVREAAANLPDQVDEPDLSLAGDILEEGAEDELAAGELAEEVAE